MKLNDEEENYRSEMLNFAKTLEGRKLSKVEQEVRDEQDKLNDNWHYFMIFGIQPETQQYINKTLLETCDKYANLCTCNVRLDLSVKDLNVEYPKESKMKKHLDDYNIWKQNHKD